MRVTKLNIHCRTGLVASNKGDINIVVGTTARTAIKGRGLHHLHARRAGTICVSFNLVGLHGHIFIAQAVH